MNWKSFLGLGPGQVDDVSNWKSILGLGPGQVDDVSNSAWAPLARSPPTRLLDTLSDRYRTTALESNRRRSLICHILRFIKEQDL